MRRQITAMFCLVLALTLAAVPFGNEYAQKAEAAVPTLISAAGAGDNTTDTETDTKTDDEEYVNTHVLVCFRKGTSKKKMKKAAKYIGGKIDWSYGTHFGFALVLIEPASLQAIRKKCTKVEKKYKYVLSASPDYIEHLMNPEQEQ